MTVAPGCSLVLVCQMLSIWLIWALDVESLALGAVEGNYLLFGRQMLSLWRICALEGGKSLLLRRQMWSIWRIGALEGKILVLGALEVETLACRGIE